MDPFVLLIHADVFDASNRVKWGLQLEEMKKRHSHAGGEIGGNKVHNPHRMSDV